MTARIAGHVVYDADCGFCTRSAHWVDKAPVPWQSLDLDAVGATADQAENFAGFLSADGVIIALGAPAIAAAMRARGGWTRPIGWLMTLPVVRNLAALLYPVLARNRHKLPGGTPACEPPPPGKDVP